MNRYHRLGGLEKSALAAAAGAVGRSLLTKGLWGSVANGGARLAGRAGTAGMVGRGLSVGAQGMAKASPYLGAYGLAGTVGEATGHALPGSELAFNLAMPGMGALAAAPNLIRSGRLAGGGYNSAIAEDAQAGARQAGIDWMTAGQADPTAAYDPQAYARFLQQNGIDTGNAGRYMGGGHATPNAWSQLGSAFTNPTGLAIPEVQQQIRGRMQKQAMAMLRGAAQAGGKAYSRGRAAGQWMPSAGLRAISSGYRSTPVAAFARANPVATSVIGLAPFAMPSVYDGYQAATEAKPYDETQIQQEGYDGAQGAIRHRLGGLSQFERLAARFDPSLAVRGMEQALPGTVAGWEQQSGRAYNPGILGSVMQTWDNFRAPGTVTPPGASAKPPGGSHYSYDALGNRNYL